MGKPKLSIITPTVRIEGLDIVDKALRRQTYRDFEWIIGSPEKPKGLITEFKWVEDPEKEEGDQWVLNKAYNKMIREADGELLVSWQDYTFADPDALEKFYYHFEEEPNVLVTAVGNKYEEVYPHPKDKIWQDPRERSDQGDYYGCFFNDIEWNLASIPRQAVYDVGGFDEKLDKHFGMDAYSVNHRIAELGGYDFKIDQTIKSYSLPHGRPEGWEENNAIRGPYKERVEEIREKGRWPVLEYLKTS